jgi:uncharacterized protein (TIGR02145 family)
MNKLFKSFVTKALVVYGAFVFGNIFVACGDDSSSSQDVEEVDGKSSSSSVKKRSSSSVEPIIDVKDKPVNETDSLDLSEFDNGGVVADKQSNRVYEVQVLGYNSWTVENIDKKTDHPTSTCYNYADSLCEKNGRLYSNIKDAEKVCPDGYELPRAIDYRILFESKNNFKHQYAGSCKAEKGERLDCSGIKDTVFYLTRDDSIVVVPKKGSLKVVKNDGRFGSIRCMRPQTILEEYQELPKCVKAYGGRTFYVVEKDSAYKCNDTAWVYTSKYAACEDGEKYLYKGKSDTLYTCRDSMWNIAGLDDIGKPCLDSNRHQDVTLNGSRYVCSDTGWTALKSPELELGECYWAIFGTAVKTDSNKTYVCRNTGRWARATPDDLYGKCTNRFHGVFVSIDSIHYFCTTIRSPDLYGNYSWFSDNNNINAKYGFCTDDRVQDTVIYADTYYICKYTNEWVAISNNIYAFPRCDSTRWDTIATVGHKEYICNRYAKKWQEAKHWLFDGQKDSIACLPKTYGKIYTQNDVKYACGLDKDNLFEFSKPTDIQLKYGVCGLDTVFEVTEKDVYYSCKGGQWSNRKLSTCEVNFGFCKQGMNVVKALGDSTCSCTKGFWSRRLLSVVEKEFEICTNEKDYIIFYGPNSYECHDGSVWASTTIDSHYERVFGSCKDDGKNGVDTAYYGQRFVCDTSASSKWIRYKEADSVAGTHCKKDLVGETIVLSDSSYRVCSCANLGCSWVKSGTWKYMSTCNAASEGLIESNGVTRSVCRNSKWVPADTFHVTDKRDGKEYAAITIGGKTWMAEPLAYMPEGQAVYVTRNHYPVEKIEYYDIAYYPWAVAMGLGRAYDSTLARSLFKNEPFVQGICMDGWHLPTRKEAEKLSDDILKHFTDFQKLYEKEDIVGIHFNKIKDMTIKRNEETGVDTISYSGSGYEYERMWSTEEYSTRSAYVISLENYYKYYSTSKYKVFPIRCVRDDE